MFYSNSQCSISYRKKNEFFNTREMLNPVSKEVSGNKEKDGKLKYIFRVQLFFGNKSQQSITNFSSSIQSTAELEVSEKQPVPAQVNPGEQIVQIFNIQCNKVKTIFF